METVLLTVIIFLVVRLAVQNFRVDGTSMLYTVRNNDLVLVDKVDYLFSSPSRGDVIVFHPPVDPKSDYIKRVIGTPGDVVQIKANKGVWINGKKLNEPYLLKFCPGNAPGTAPAITAPSASDVNSYKCEIPNYNWGPAKVPRGKYFVLGDNRNDSYDSHAWCSQGGAGDTEPCSLTWVKQSAIVGKAFVAYWPFSDFKFFSF